MTPMCFSPLCCYVSRSGVRRTRLYRKMPIEEIVLVDQQNPTRLVRRTYYLVCILIVILKYKNNQRSWDLVSRSDSHLYPKGCCAKVTVIWVSCCLKRPPSFYKLGGLFLSFTATSMGSLRYPHWQTLWMMCRHC